MRLALEFEIISDSILSSKLIGIIYFNRFLPKFSLMHKYSPFDDKLLCIIVKNSH